jgi:hypothetical protein
MNLSQIGAIALGTVLLLAAWGVLTALHHMHPADTPGSAIARQMVAGIGIASALLSPWPQSLVVALLTLAVYVAWGALLAVPRRIERSRPPSLPPDAWRHVSGGMSQGRTVGEE